MKSVSVTLLPARPVRFVPSSVGALAVLLLAACGGDAKGPPAPPPHVEAVMLNAGSVVVELMDSARVTVSVRMSDGHVSSRAVLWDCTRPELIRACGPEIVPRDTGSYLLIAHLDGVADTALVRIYEEGMRDVVITDPAPWTPQWLLQGTGVVMKLQITDSLNVPRLDRRLRWTSSDSSVAVVRDTTWWNWNVGAWWPGGAVQPREPGSATLTVTVGGQQASLQVVVRPRAAACDAARALSLDLEVGELRRFRGTDADLPGCLQFRHGRDAGRRYLVMAERLPVASGSQSGGRRGVFLVDGGVPAPDSMIVQLYTPLTTAAQLMAARAGAVQQGAAPAADAAEWHIGGQHAGELPARRERALREVRHGARAGLQALAQLPGGSTPIAVGDTLVIPRLRTIAHDAVYSGTGSRSDRAVVQYVGESLVFAEHIELFGTDLRRFNGQSSQPVPAAEYARIDAAYAPGQTQLDRLFGRSPTDSLLGLPPGRELVVNTILPNGVWGTAAGDMAIIDYWYGTNGSSPGTLQDPLLLTNQLIVHEFAHVRHLLLQPPAPLLLWSLEGIARFAEHLAFAAHVLGGDEPSRSGNVIAGAAGYPTSPQLRQHIELPTAAALGSNFFGGYSASAHVFDYLADHAEAAGRDGLFAVRDVLLGAHSRSTADAAVARALGEPVPLDELITRARIALVLDDYPTTAILPPWTQYLQFNVRSSRPWTPNWPNAVPGGPFAVAQPLAEGVVWGVFINGTLATGDQDFLLDVTRGEQSVLSVVRIQ
jgi:hypothetical protein